jgi:hypothetical protein
MAQGLQGCQDRKVTHIFCASIIDEFVLPILDGVVPHEGLPPAALVLPVAQHLLAYPGSPRSMHGWPKALWALAALRALALQLRYDMLASRPLGLACPTGSATPRKLG